MLIDIQQLRELCVFGCYSLWRKFESNTKNCTNMTASMENWKAHAQLWIPMNVMNDLFGYNQKHYQPNSTITDKKVRELLEIKKAKLKKKNSFKS